MMQYNLDWEIKVTPEETIEDFIRLHPSSYVVIRDEKTNTAVVEIKGTLEFNFTKGTKTFSIQAKEMPDDNKPITIPPHQFKINDDGTATIYHKEDINPVAVSAKKKTSKKKKPRKR